MSGLDILAVGAHPDDVALGCGGTLATATEGGRRVGILHLTRGEAGTRGTPVQRRREAKRAAEILGASELEFLDCGDGGLRQDPAREDALIAAIRRLEPEIVLGPSPSDRHPDHGRAHRLVADACYYAGLRQRGEGNPHRPGAVFSYMQHDPFSPAFVVDVTAAWPVKQAALDAYESQLYQGEEDSSDDPPTKVASSDFRAAVEGRARHFGLLIGATFGEPFWSPLPLAVSDPLDLLPGGLR